MSKAKVNSSSVSPKQVRPSLDPESREKQLISEAYDLVEQRLLNGTATSQETTHFLKLGSTKHNLELDKLREENRLLKAKTEALESAKNTETLYSEALKAMRSYTGQGSEEVDDEEEY